MSDRFTAGQTLTAAHLNTMVDETAEARTFAAGLFTEGAWTPVLRAAGTATGTGTMLGVWSRANNLVFVHCDIRLTAAPTVAGVVTITGCPFVARRPTALGVVSYGGVAAGTGLSAVMVNNVISLTKGPPNGVSAAVQGADVALNGSIELTGTFGIAL